MQQIGLPVVVLPLNGAKRVLAEGRACCTPQELAEALRWACTFTDLVRIIPVAAISD